MASLNGYGKTVKILTIISFVLVFLGGVIAGGIKYDKHKTKTDSTAVRVDSLESQSELQEIRMSKVEFQCYEQDRQNKLVLKYLDKISKKLKVEVSPISEDTVKKSIPEIIFRGR